MTFESTMTEKDFVRACWLGTIKRSPVALLALAVFPCLGILMLGMGVLAVSLGQSWSSQLPGNAMALLLATSPMFFYPYLFRRSFRKSPFLAEQRTFHIDSEGLQITGSEYNSAMKWNMFSKFTEDDGVFVVFQQGNTIFFPVPKRGLTKEQISEIGDTLQRNLKRV